ncbi:DUF5106 domain-containing protein [uncultured Muribaculum sp.]|uniref:DUF5106 domain-containing protein n=1 Tax=uncultured Muribaculum sp. TaxID=1918613 RepID=UPI0025B736D4|nr:DUF5106 domain-containing protein [uncultured Muribaculum sp.]
MNNRCFCALLLNAVLLCLGGTGTVLYAQVARHASLRLPVVPDSLTDTTLRLTYVLEHYWDNMPWDDNGACADTTFVEQSMVDFLDLMSHADSTLATGAYAHFLDLLPKRMYGWLTDMTCEYLYAPDSPVYNPETFASAADAILAHGALDSYKLLVLKDRHASIMKNRVGHNAADFDLVTLDGERKRLYDAVAGSKRVLLLFYDPDCEVCAELEQRLALSDNVNAAIARKDLAIVAVDPFGTPEQQWREHASTLPRTWTVGYSPEGKVYEDEVYVISVAPVVYLLDGNMRVQVKDASGAQLASWLAQ